MNPEIGNVSRISRIAETQNSGINNEIKSETKTGFKLVISPERRSRLYSALSKIIILSTFVACTPTAEIPIAATETLQSTVTPTITATPTPIETATPTLIPTATAIATIENMKSLNVFIKECVEPDVEDDVSCIFADGILALHLRRGGKDGLPINERFAQVWNEAWDTGQVVGILAHNYSAGKTISKLSVGETIYLIWSNGNVDEYTINEKTKWRDEGGWKVFSPWDGGEKVSEDYLNDHYYREGDNFNRMVLQTCDFITSIKLGPLFIVATRK